MSQYDGTNPITDPWAGGTAAADIQKLIDHVLSQGAGATRPAELEAGGVWAKDLGGGDFELYLFDGTDDIRIPMTGQAANFSTLKRDGVPVASIAQTPIYVPEANVAMASNTITVTTGLSVAAPSEGMKLLLKVPSTNTDATDIVVDGHTAVAVKTVPYAADGANKDLPAGYIRTDVWTELEHDGTQFIASRRSETGTAATGKFTRFEDGTVLARMTLEDLGRWGPGNEDIGITFPIEFEDTQDLAVVVTAVTYNSNNVEHVFQIRPPTTTGCTLQYRPGYSLADADPLILLMGLWF